MRSFSVRKKRIGIMLILSIVGMSPSWLCAQQILLYKRHEGTGISFSEKEYVSLAEPVKAILLYYGVRGLAPTDRYKENALTEALGIQQCGADHYAFIQKWIDDEEVLEDFSHCQNSKLSDKSYYMDIAIQMKQDTVYVKYTSRLYQNEVPSSWVLKGMGTFVIDPRTSKVHFLGEKEKIETKGKQ